jgi:hypothetical protein
MTATATTIIVIQTRRKDRVRFDSFTLVVPIMKDGVRCVLRWYDPHTWLVILLFVAPSMSSQAYNCRTRRMDHVRFDLRTLGHNHGTGHGWCSSTTAANGVSPFPVFGVYEDFDDDADDDHRRSLRVNLRPDRGTEPRRDSGGRRGREQGGRTTTSRWCGRRNDVRY